MGEYRLFGLHPGHYFIRAQPPGGSGAIIGEVLLEDSILKSAGGYVPTYYPGVPDISRASAFEVKSGDEIAGMDITLLRGSSYKIRGVVVNAVTGHRGGHVSVEVIPRDMESASEFSRSGEVDEKTGEFEIDDVRNGSYLIFASYRDGEDEFNGSAPIEVLNAHLNSVRVIITEGVEIHGRVLLDGKITASRAAVHVSPKDKSTIGPSESGSVAADGTFRLRGFTDGLYEVDVHSDCSNCYLKSASANGTDILDSGLQISGAAPSSIELLYSNKIATIDGSVARADGTPAPDATVVLVPDSPRRDQIRLYSQVAADQYSRFALKNVVPGKYHAFAWEKVSWDDFTDADFLREFESQGVAVSVGEHEKKTLDLKLIPATGNK